MEKIITFLQEHFIVIAFFIIGIVVTRYVYRFLAKYNIRKYRKQGVTGEDIARKWLPRNGYEIVSEQKQFIGSWILNGEIRKFKVKPDFIVKRDGELWVIEVKTGTVASPTCSKTRRQILEYSSICPDHRIALFDATNKHLYKVKFPNLFSSSVNKTSKIWVFIVGVILGFVCSIILNLFLKVY